MAAKVKAGVSTRVKFRAAPAISHSCMPIPVQGELAPLANVEAVPENETGALPAGKPARVKSAKFVLSLWKCATPGWATLPFGDAGVSSTSANWNPVNAPLVLLVRVSLRVMRNPKSFAAAGVFSMNERLIGLGLVHTEFSDNVPLLVRFGVTEKLDIWLLS